MENILSSEIVFTCPLFKVEYSKVELPNGTIEDRWYVIKNDAVGIIAIDTSNNILLTREYRSASKEIRWRIPAGGLKDEEIPENGARRELREETGYDSENIELLFTKKIPSGWIKQSSHFFLAKNLFASPLKSNEYENIEIIPTSIDLAIQKVKEGEIGGNIGEAILEAGRRLNMNK